MHGRLFDGIRITGALTLLLSLMIASNARGFHVEPMSYELAPSGHNSRITLQVRNTHARPIAVELDVYSRAMDKSGELEQTPEEEDFLVFPPQTMIDPGEAQAIRVQYIGAPDIEHTRVYTVAVRQVPVRDPDEETSGVEVVFSFGTAAYVVPPGSRADVRIREVSLTEDGKAVRIALANEGARHANLIEMDWLLTGANGTSQEFDEEVLETSLGNPMIYAGGQRLVEIPLEDEWNDTDVTLELRQGR